MYKGKDEDLEVDFKAIGKRIRTRREAINMTREELAELLCVSHKFCGDIEYGLRGMSLKTLIKLSEALNLSMDYIIKGHDQKNTVEFGEDNMVMENILTSLYACNDKQLKQAGQMVKIFAEAVNGGE